MQKEIELNNENKETKNKSEISSSSNNYSEEELDDNEKSFKKPSRRKRGFQMSEAELSDVQKNAEGSQIKESEKDKTEQDNLTT